MEETLALERRITHFFTNLAENQYYTFRSHSLSITIKKLSLNVKLKDPFKVTPKREVTLNGTLISARQYLHIFYPPPHIPFILRIVAKTSKNCSKSPHFTVINDLNKRK